MKGKRTRQEPGVLWRVCGFCCRQCFPTPSAVVQEGVCPVLAHLSPPYVFEGTVPTFECDVKQVGWRVVCVTPVLAAF